MGDSAMLTTLTVASSLAAYRGALHVLSKGMPGSLANLLFKVLGGGGPGEPEDRK